MEIFKLLERTIPNVEPGHPDTRELRRDQLLDNVESAITTLHTLVRAKEDEITHTKNLVEMLERSKRHYDDRLTKAQEAYKMARDHAPESMDLKSLDSKVVELTGSTTPPFPPPPTALSPGSAPNPVNPSPNSFSSSQASVGTGSHLTPDLPEIPLPTESVENRTSLDRRLSEFLKTFPNLTQSGVNQPTTDNGIKPNPGYYTQQQQQQQQPLAPPTAGVMGPTPPMMALMRFPPPPTMMPHLIPPPTMNTMGIKDTYEHADMELSDHESPIGNNPVGVIPMVANAMQQGAGGKNRPENDHGRGYSASQPHSAGASFQYAPRLNPLAFDPSIIDTSVRDAPASTRDHHTYERGTSRHSGGSSTSSGSRHGSSSSSSGRNKRR